jgi:hypothetical protein
LKRRTVCGVSEISGTSTSTVLPTIDHVPRGLEIDLGLAGAGHA